jgi:hypothetical protein
VHTQLAMIVQEMAELTVVTKEVNKIFFYQGIAESKVI